MQKVVNAYEGRALWVSFETMLGRARFWIIAGLCCAGILAWAGRHSLTPDGLSYIDLASAAVDGGPGKLVNGYWSPGYPALIGIAFLLFHPSATQEFPLVHTLNVLIFGWTLWSFTFFYKEWRAAVRVERSGEVVNHLPGFAVATFLWFILNFIGVTNVSPDLCVAAIVFLAAGVVYRICLPGSTWKDYGALGLVLGLGYYFKAALFPLSLILLGLLIVLWPSPARGGRPKVLFATAVFLLVTAPLVTVLSVHARRFTFGDAGRINYAWFVNGRVWTATMEHPAPKLLTSPVTLVFASPIGGTYPLWYDPSYWYANAQVRFDLRQQIHAFEETVRTYKEIVYQTIAYTAGAIVLAVFSFRRGAGIPRTVWWQLAWPAAALSMYALVTVEPRYVGAFLALFYLGLYGALVLQVHKEVAGAVCATVLIAAVFPFGALFARTTSESIRDALMSRPPDYQVAARALQHLGLVRGDNLAVVGYAHDCYYARCARMRVVAQIPDDQAFWRLSAPEVKAVADRLAAVGVKAIVAFDRPAASGDAGWNDLALPDSRKFSILILQRAVKPPAGAQMHAPLSADPDRDQPDR